MKEIPRDTCIYFKSEQRFCFANKAEALFAKSRACDRLQPAQGALAPQGFSGRL